MILDLFAGPGGWDQGIRLLGHTGPVVGIEWDSAACATRTAAGHLTIRTDVAHYPAAPFAGKVDGLIASPPCQDFSLAGKQVGRAGERGQLIDEVPRWVLALKPRWVACEQVPPALEVYKEFAHLFRRWGYRTWCGILNAADFGVPQTRQRAFLLASLNSQPQPPEPTHAKHPHPTMFGNQREPWVSMAAALGWGVPSEPSPVVMTARNRQTGADVLRGSSWRAEWFDRQQADGNWVVRTGANTMKHGRTPDDIEPYERPVDEPAPTLDGKVGSAWKLHTNRGQDEDGNRQTVELDRPAPSLTGKAGGQWVYERPATTIAGDPRVAPPGHKDENRRQMDDAIRLTVREALILQGFDPDYPVHGTKTKQFEQVGNAVPPPLAAAVLSAVIGTAKEAAA